MATIQKRSRINRWAGPLSDITEAGKLVVSTLNDWTGHDPECEVEIAFPNATRRDHLMEMLDRRVDTRDMSSISSIRVRVGGDQGPLGIVHLETSEPMYQNDANPAVTLEVTNDESQVDALLKVSAESLDVGANRRSRIAPADGGCGRRQLRCACHRFA